MGRLRTVRDLVRYATSRLQQTGVVQGHGTSQAIDEAVWLVCWILHLPFDRFDDLADAAVMPSEVRATIELLRQRCTTRRPLAYLIGEAWLMGQRFLSDDRALVPRSLIAEVMQSDAFVERMAHQPEPEAVLDLCCGGGSLAILAARQFPHAEVVASDISRPALALAADNIALHNLKRRVSTVQGNLFENLDGQKFDLIVCNPPYVNAASMDALPAEYRAEPRAALDGGPDGMDLVEHILAGAGAHLHDHGLLLLEIGHEVEHFVARFPQIEWMSMDVAQGPDMVLAIDAASLPGPDDEDDDGGDDAQGDDARDEDDPMKTI